MVCSLPMSVKTNKTAPRNMCLVVVTTRLFFCCEGGILASIEDFDEQKFIKSQMEKFIGSETSFWIGIYKTHKGIITLHEKITLQKSCT